MEFQKASARSTTSRVGRVSDYSNIVLACGHPAPGLPKVSNPDKWFCATCRAWKRRGRA